MKKIIRSKNGFSLVELLIVLTLLVILIGIGIPVTGSIVNNSRIKTDKANVELFQYSIEKLKILGKSYPKNKDEVIGAIKQYSNFETVPAPKTSGKIFVYDKTTHKFSVIDKDDITSSMININ